MIPLQGIWPVLSFAQCLRRVITVIPVTPYHVIMSLISHFSSNQPETGMRMEPEHYKLATPKFFLVYTIIYYDPDRVVGTER